MANQNKNEQERRNDRNRDWERERGHEDRGRWGGREDRQTNYGMEGGYRGEQEARGYYGQGSGLENQGRGGWDRTGSSGDWNREGYRGSSFGQQHNYGQPGYGQQHSASQGGYDQQGGSSYSPTGYSGQRYGEREHDQEGYGRRRMDLGQDQPAGGAGYERGYVGPAQSASFGRGSGIGRATYGQGTSFGSQESYGASQSPGGFFGDQYGSPQYGNRGYGNYGSYGGGMGSQMMSGRHVGKGPKGYQRSDERIREDVSERLAQHPEIDATDIEVQVNNGEVTLTGTVEERHIKRMAEDVAEGLSGVKEVHNQLRVRSHTEGQAVGTSSTQSTASPTGTSSSGSSTNRK
jgi:hypothetical protein